MVSRTRFLFVHPPNTVSMEFDDSDVIEFAKSTAHKKWFTQDIPISTGWNYVKTFGMDKVTRALNEGMHSARGAGAVVSRAVFSSLFTITYNMCNERTAKVSDIVEMHNNEHRTYLQTVVLPSILEKHDDEAVLVEFARRWEDHLVLTKWLWKFLFHIDRSRETTDAAVLICSPLVRTLAEPEAYGGAGAGAGADATMVDAHDPPSYTSLSLTSHALKAFYDVIVIDCRVNEKLCACASRLMNKSRDGHEVDLSCVAAVSRAIQRIGVALRNTELEDVDHFNTLLPSEDSVGEYVKHMETACVLSASEYYRSLASRMRDTLSPSEYVHAADAIFDAECARVLGSMHETTVAKVERILEDILLVSYEKELCSREDAGFASMVRKAARSDVQCVGKLYGRVEGAHARLAEVLRNEITRQGDEVVRAREKRLASDAGGACASNDPDFVTALMAVMHHHIDVVESSLACDVVYEKQMRIAFESLWSMDRANVSNSVVFANYIDAVLKGCVARVKLSDEEVAAQITAVVRVMVYLRDKDIFGEQYRSQLSRRMLHGKDKHSDCETRMISEMKRSFGCEFTIKLSGMITDMRLCKDMNDEFNKSVSRALALAASTSAPATDGVARSSTSSKAITSKATTLFSAVVLTKGHWPSFRLLDMHLPPPMSSAVMAYTQHYMHMFNTRRKLTWVYSLGCAEMSARFAEGKRHYVFVMSTVQAVVLYYIGAAQQRRWSFKEIHSMVGGEDDVLKKVLHSFACNKRAQIMLKFPSDGFIRDTDEFEVNTRFKSQSFRIDIPVPKLEEDKAEQKVAETRPHTIDAMIVRIMKARKTLHHNELEAEVLRKLQWFKPSPRDIKVQIELLINREYLDRSDDNQKVYNYVA